MRSITALLVFSVVACHDSSDIAKDHPLAIPAGDDGRPALPSGDKTHEAATTDRTSVMVAWHEQLAKARVRFGFFSSIPNSASATRCDIGNMHAPALR